MSPAAKNTLIISGIAVGAIGIGFLGYKIYIRLTKDVIEGEHNTIMVQKSIPPPEEVESVGWEDEPQQGANQMTADELYGYYGDSLSKISDAELQKYLNDYAGIF